MPVLVEDKKSSYVILLDHDASVVERFAAAELSRYLEKMSGAQIPIVTEARRGGRTLRVAVKDRKSDDDGFAIKVKGSDVLLEGNGPRGALYAVYHFLESLGVRWFFLGSEGEVVPKMGRVELKALDVQEKPAFPKRGIAGGTDDPASVCQWIDLLGKLRLNTVFFHVWPFRGSKMPDGGRWHGYEWWDENKKFIMPELEKRGMTFEFGGHWLAEQIPRSMFVMRPDFFRVAEDGKRHAEYNLCPSNEDALKYVAEQVKEYVKTIPEIRYLHFWPDDLWGGGWCHCEKCKGFSSSDQSLLTMNYLAEAIAKVNPEAKLAFLAYHDTEAPPTKVKPSEHLFLLFAPRPRCYAHPLTDETCKRNQPFREHLKGLAALFPEDFHVFEYYTDPLVLAYTWASLSKVIKGDARFYLSVGVNNYQTLLFSGKPWYTPPLPLIVFARAGWNPDCNTWGVIDDYCEKWFGKASAEMKKYFHIFEEIMEKVWVECGYPLHDEPAEERAFGKVHLKKVNEAILTLPTMGRCLDEAERKAEDPVVRERLEAARKEFQRLGEQLQWIREQIEKYGVLRT